MTDDVMRERDSTTLYYQLMALVERVATQVETLSTHQNEIVDSLVSLGKRVLVLEAKLRLTEAIGGARLDEASVLAVLGEAKLVTK